jgi:hypothetical protein
LNHRCKHLHLLWFEQTAATAAMLTTLPTDNGTQPTSCTSSCTNTSNHIPGSTSSAAAVLDQMLQLQHLTLGTEVPASNRWTLRSNTDMQH